MELWQVYHPHKYTVELNWMVLVIDGDFIQGNKDGRVVWKENNAPIIWLLTKLFCSNYKLYMKCHLE